MRKFVKNILKIENRKNQQFTLLSVACIWNFTKLNLSDCIHITYMHTHAHAANKQIPSINPIPYMPLYFQKSIISKRASVTLYNYFPHRITGTILCEWEKETTTILSEDMRSIGETQTNGQKIRKQTSKSLYHTLNNIFACYPPLVTSLFFQDIVRNEKRFCISNLSYILFSVIFSHLSQLFINLHNLRLFKSWVFIDIAFVLFLFLCFFDWHFSFLLHINYVVFISNRYL